MEGFAKLQATVQATIETHCPEVARWDKDMSGEGQDEGSRGVLPTLRGAEEALQSAHVRYSRVSHLVDVQNRYRQDCGKLSERVKALYEQAAEEDANGTDLKRQEMHARSMAVFEKVKALTDRVRRAQEAYRRLGIDVRGGGGGEDEGLGKGVEGESLSHLRQEVRDLGERLRQIRYVAGEEGLWAAMGTIPGA
ncbi:hypothetical protein NGA_0169500 [Nannochloropsis gaditana CCMP526]|uniref:uncharacterized protein n=1 Tax=Nannochloropsis gaditana (strain CCMP526) TaxID=1093141 RepID=UPI00029F66A9|nr:hypothetical protein NGA_0169500 [Nannochloropsis gaditana CCMP526]EKU21729.1 hypothetical protein NGA_0169500 [Nannochloropsis gaditana CCMP526]|eukprot:XP_005854631.1 hypothetical protein NGA_0169500 [Nannochloropsis gaditana CCMP526]